MRHLTTTAAAAAAMTLLAACGATTGTTGTPASPPASSARPAPATAAPLTGTQAANRLVCRHYLAQRAWVKHLSFPTLADAVKFEGYVAADAAQATGKLHADLAAMMGDERARRSSYAASLRVYHDCAR